MIDTTKGKGPRFYFKTDNPKVKYPGVTSIVGMLPKPFLQFWSAKMAAELAVDSLDFVKSIHDRGGHKAAVQYISGAARRYTEERSEIGSKAHDLMERMIRGENVRHVHPDMEPYRRNFAEFLDAVQPELVRAEDVAWSDAYQYAGSFDAVLRIKLDDAGKPHRHGDPALLMVDWKTSKNTYPDVALQMSAYAHADVMVDPHGNESPMPEFDGAAVLHTTTDGWEFTPVRIDYEDVFGTFLHLREVFRWEREISKTVLGDHIAESARAFESGTERRAR